MDVGAMATTRGGLLAAEWVSRVFAGKPPKAKETERRDPSLVALASPSLSEDSPFCFD